MHVVEKIKKLCIYHATIIELGDDNYYSDWISHSNGLPDEPMLSTLCEIDDREFLVIKNFFIRMLCEFEKEHDINTENMRSIIEKGEKEGEIFYNALIYQFLEDMSV